MKGPDLTLLRDERKLQQIEKELVHPTVTQGYQAVIVWPRDGRTLRGFARNESIYDLELQDWQGRFHFLRQRDIARITFDQKPLMPPVQLSEKELHNLLAYLISPTAPKGVPESKLGSVTPGAGDWATYNGQLGGNRYSLLDQINVKNVSQLASR